MFIRTEPSLIRIFEKKKLRSFSSRIGATHFNIINKGAIFFILNIFFVFKYIHTKFQGMIPGSEGSL